MLQDGNVLMLEADSDPVLTGLPIPMECDKMRPMLPDLNSDPRVSTLSLRATAVPVVFTTIARTPPTFGRLRRSVRRVLGYGTSITPCRAWTAIPTRRRSVFRFVAFRANSSLFPFVPSFWRSLFFHSHKTQTDTLVQANSLPIFHLPWDLFGS